MPRLGNTQLAFMLLVVSACGSETEYELYNNTGASLTIDNCGGDLFIAAGERGIIYECADPGPAVLANERKSTYSTLPGQIAEPGYVTRRRSRLQVKLQLEPDGSIIAIKTGDEPPVRSDYPQPPGFPIRPDSMELLR